MGQLSALIVVVGMALLHLLPMTVSILLCCNLTFANPDSRDHIDLGYARHTVTSTNTTARGHKIDVYKNICFAKSPVGELRFKYAQEPAKQPDIQNGTISHDSTCIS